MHAESWHLLNRTPATAHTHGSCFNRFISKSGTASETHKSYFNQPLAPKSMSQTIEPSKLREQPNFWRTMARTGLWILATGLGGAWGRRYDGVGLWVLGLGSKVKGVGLRV